MTHDNGESKLNSNYTPANLQSRKIKKLQTVLGILALVVGTIAVIGCSITLFTILEINDQMKQYDIRYVMQLYDCGMDSTSMCQGDTTYLLSENNFTFAQQKANELEGHGNYEIQIETLDHRTCCGEWKIMTEGYGFGGEKLP